MGESGPGARPFHIEWARSLRDQCKASGTAFFMKQFGANAFYALKDDDTGVVVPDKYDTLDPKGGDPMEWPEDLRVRQFPGVVG